MPPIDLYCHIVAPFWRSVMLLARALDIELNLIEIDVLKRQQYQPEFLALNPQHCIPTIVDGDVVVWESNAILIYLAERYGTDERNFYPKSPGERAQVNRLLFFQLGTLHRALSTYYYPILTKTGEGKQEDFRKIQDAVCTLNKFLVGNKWLAGERLTVADFSIVISIAALEGVIKFDLTGYRNVSRWYQQCKAEIKGFQELTMEAVAKSQQCLAAVRQYKQDQILQAQEACCNANRSNYSSSAGTDSECTSSNASSSSSKPPCPNS